MPKIKFLFFSSLQDITQTNSIEIESEGTIKQALAHIFEIYGSKFKNRIIDQNSESIKRYIIVAVNRRDIRHIDGLNTELYEGDEVSILPAAAGG